MNKLTMNEIKRIVDEDLFDVASGNVKQEELYEIIEKIKCNLPPEVKLTIIFEEHFINMKKLKMYMFICVSLGSTYYINEIDFISDESDTYSIDESPKITYKICDNVPMDVVFNNILNINSYTAKYKDYDITSKSKYFMEYFSKTVRNMLTIFHDEDDL